MIGNDLVDLQLAARESNWQRRGYLDKLFTASEQELILSSLDPFQTVWLLWTMKESAYKAYIQWHGNRFFSPKSIKTKLISKNRATVLIHDRLFYTQSEINQDVIHTTAFSEKGVKNRVSDFFKLENTFYESRHLETYHKVLQVFSDKLKLSPSLLEIKKNSLGIPQIYQNEKRLKNSLSISHHGCYGAFCIEN